VGLREGARPLGSVCHPGNVMHSTTVRLLRGALAAGRAGLWSPLVTPPSAAAEEARPPPSDGRVLPGGLPRPADSRRTPAAAAATLQARVARIGGLPRAACVVALLK
jgi:hypothetical protein